jgi:hypothetical protein
MDGELLHCIVMCHRLKGSRIATKRLSSQSPIHEPSFETRSKTMEAEASANQQGPTNNGRRCARRDATALATWSHIVSFSNLQSFPCGDQSVPGPAEVRLFNARSSRAIGKLEMAPPSCVMVAL